MRNFNFHLQLSASRAISRLFPLFPGKYFFVIFLVLLMLGGAAPRVFAQFSFFPQQDEEVIDEPVEVTADQLEYVKPEGKVIGRGNVVVIHGENRLLADYAEVFTEIKKAYAKGHVVLFQGKAFIKGEEVTYDFANHTGVFPDTRIVNPPYYVSVGKLEQVSELKAYSDEGLLTTCNAFPPHYGVKAKKITIYFDDKIIAQNLRFQVLGKSLFWWPYLVTPIDQKYSPVQVEVGYSDDWGAYALASKGVAVNKYLHGRVHTDWRSKRGFALGVDGDYTIPHFGSGNARYYYAIKDQRAPDQGLTDPEAGAVERDRYWIHAKHRVDFDPYTHLVAEFNKLEDPYVLKDFFEKYYHRETDPETYATFTRNGERYGFLVNVEQRVNDFFSTIEKAPEVRFNWNNQRLPNLPIYFQNETSAIAFNRRVANSSDDDDTVRLDFFNEVSYPKKLFNINFLPFGNVRQDYYSKNAFGKENVNRTILGLGGEASTRFFRVFDIDANPFGIQLHQLRHILEPSVVWNSNRLVTEGRENLFQMDEVDSLRAHDEFKYGVRNKLQTKRMVNGEWQRVELLSLSNFATYEVHAEPDSWLYFDTEVEFRPFNWLIFHHKNRFDFERDRFSEGSLNLELRSPEKWHFFISHNFVGEVQNIDNPDEATSLITTDLLYKINELWRVGGFLRHDFDDRVLEEAQIRFIRDLHCWMLEFGLNHRDLRAGEATEVEAFFQLALKAFPDYVAKSGSRASYSRARFGDLIAGSEDPAFASQDQIFGY